MPTDEYIDEMLDETTGYANALLEHLLDERDLMFAAMLATGAIQRRP